MNRLGGGRVLINLRILYLRIDNVLPIGSMILTNQYRESFLYGMNGDFLVTTKQLGDDLEISLMLTGNLWAVVLGTPRIVEFSLLRFELQIKRCPLLCWKNGNRAICLRQLKRIPARLAVVWAPWKDLYNSAFDEQYLHKVFQRRAITGLRTLRVSGAEVMRACDWPKHEVIGCTSVHALHYGNALVQWTWLLTGLLTYGVSKNLLRPWLTEWRDEVVSSSASLPSAPHPKFW